MRGHACNSSSMAFLHLKAIAIPAIPPRVSTIKSWPKKLFCPCGLYLALKKKHATVANGFFGQHSHWSYSATATSPEGSYSLLTFLCQQNFESIGWVYVLVLSHGCPKGHSNYQLSTALWPWRCPQFQSSSCIFLSTCAFKRNQPQLLKHLSPTVPTLDTCHQKNKGKTVGYGSRIWIFTGETEEKAPQGCLIHESSP